MRLSLLFSCLIWVIICLIVSGLSGWVSASHITGWYQSLNQASFNPPSWIFGPVWTVLYIMIGIVGGVLWHLRKQHPIKFMLFCLQLVFNFAWSFIFFVGQSPGWALIDIIALWLSILLLLVVLSRHAKHAKNNNKKWLVWLLVPYFVWVSFAVILNYFIYVLN